MATATQPAVTFSWEALQNSNPWQALTDKQRVWCLHWLTNGHDAVKATQMAYHCASPRNAACLSHEVKNHPKVITFLELYRVLTEGAPSREEQIAGALETIREAPAYEQVKARRLLAQLTGFVRDDAETVKDAPTAEAPKTGASSATFYVGQLVNQRGPDGVLHTGRVIAIDAEGRATEIEEVK